MMSDAVRARRVIRSHIIPGYPLCSIVLPADVCSLWTPAQRSLSEVHVMFCECYFLFFYDRLMLRPRLTEVRGTFTRGGP